MIIFENVTSQRALEQASKFIVDKLEQQLDSALSSAPWNPSSLVLKTQDLNIRTADDQVNKMLKEGIIAYIFLSKVASNELGVWNGKVHDDSVAEVGLLKLILDISSVTAVSQVISRYRIKKPQLYSTALHELQHAFDNWRSGDIDDFETSDSEGTYQHSGRARGYIDKKFIDHAKAGIDASHDDYLNYSHEINARYAQAIADTKAAYKGSPAIAAKWMNKFKSNFDGWHLLSAHNKKRLLSRAGAEHTEYNKIEFKGKDSNLARAVKGFGVKFKRDAKFNRLGYWFSSFEYMGNKSDDLLDALEMLSHKTNGVITIPLSDIKKNSGLYNEMKSRMKSGDWSRVGSDHMIFRPN